MNWLIDIQWFILFVILMKVAILGAVASWMITIMADRPCSEYCVYLSTAVGNMEFLTGCDCMYDRNGFLRQLERMGIYYDSANILQIPQYIYNLPFYINNPRQGRQNDPTNNNPVPLEIIRLSSNSRRHNTVTEFNNVQNTHFVQNRQENDIQSNNNRATAPFYLDVNAQPENERSASTRTFTTENLNRIEQNLSECTDLHALLHIKKNIESKIKNIPTTSQTLNYGHFSITDLEKKVDDKCSRISSILEESFNDIKETRPKKTSDTSRKKGKSKENNKLLSPNGTINTTNKPTSCINTTEAAYFNEHDKSKIKERDEEASTSAANIQSSSVLYDKMEDDSAGGVTPIYTENQYPLNIETTRSRTASIVPLESSTFHDVITASTNTAERESFLKSRGTAQEFWHTNIEGRTENRSQYEESDVPLTKIITHEFSNNTVQSYINGTEDIPNGDFKDEMETTEISYEAKDSSEISKLSKYNGMPDEHLATTSKADNVSSESDISGNMYFVFNRHQIPARFVQNGNGSLNVGVDGATLCNKLSEDEGRNSKLLKTLCKCYKSGNCNHKTYD